MSFREKLSEKVEIPKDVSLNYPKITAIGNNELSVENYKGILEYSDERIKANTMTHILVIEGEELFIKKIEGKEMLINGKIKKIFFECE